MALMSSAPHPAAGGDGGGGEPYFLIEPLHRSAPLLFASPHSGRRYPDEMLAAAQVNLASLRRGEDAFVDELFAGAASHGAPVLCASLARAYVDLNRDPEELDRDMFGGALPENIRSATPRVLAGLGAIPRVAGDGRAIYPAKLPIETAARRLAAVHQPYHSMLARLVEQSLAAFGCAVLIDCHSMPAPQSAADIVLGDRFGASCHPAIIAMTEASLIAMGYRVARNVPFAGGYTTQLHGRPALGRHALQIEISRSLYLNERGPTRTPGFARVKADMTRLAAALAAAEFHRSLG